MLATLLRITRWTLDRGVWVRALTGSFRFIAGKENEMLGDNLRWFIFSLLCFVIGSENLRHLLNQSNSS